MNVDAIFGAFHEASRLIHLHDAIRKKAEQIRSVNELRCGNCDHWMKSSCVPEKQHKQFRSMGSPACGAFVQDWSSKKMSADFGAELAQLTAKLTAPAHDGDEQKREHVREIFTK